MDELVELIAQWFKDRGLDKADPKAQMLKLSEEVGELAGALAREDYPEIVDAIGDITVVLIGLTQILELDYPSCVSMAYDVIKDRKGMLHNGVWLKESDYMKYLEVDMFETEITEVCAFVNDRILISSDKTEKKVSSGENVILGHGDVISLNTITNELNVIKKQED